LLTCNVDGRAVQIIVYYRTFELDVMQVAPYIKVAMFRSHLLAFISPLTIVKTTLMSYVSEEIIYFIFSEF